MAPEATGDAVKEAAKEEDEKKDPDSLHSMRNYVIGIFVLGAVAGQVLVAKRNSRVCRMFHQTRQCYATDASRYTSHRSPSPCRLPTTAPRHNHQEEGSQAGAPTKEEG
jgi:hypothetical protein